MGAAASDQLVDEEFEHLDCKKERLDSDLTGCDAKAQISQIVSEITLNVRKAVQEQLDVAMESIHKTIKTNQRLAVQDQLAEAIDSMQKANETRQKECNEGDNLTNISQTLQDLAAKFEEVCASTAALQQTLVSSLVYSFLAFSKLGDDENSFSHCLSRLLQQAVKINDERLVKILLSFKEIDVNWKNADRDFSCDVDTSDWTALHFAAYAGSAKMTDLLLSVSGIDVNVKDKYGYTPLYCAPCSGREEIVKLLLAHKGIDVNVKVKDKDGYTPLHSAACSGREEIVKLLLAHKGIDVNVKDKYGYTPLYAAAGKGHEEIVKLLLAVTGIEFNARDCWGFTPLLRAAFSGELNIVKILLAVEGIDVKAIGNLDSGETYDLLKCAERSKHEEVANLIRCLP